ncbi:hypothetical protein [Luteolibacter soli]|uniref:Pili assembly chaperone N-terminal domain-containing protein n=1 Tax=Luteolibacter soli TaxID=3135280 RepID=A0ABU9AVU1_9BACT
MAFSSLRIITFAALASSLSLAFATPSAPNPKIPPQAGVSIEVQRRTTPATAKLTNDTTRELTFLLYNTDKFSLKPGASKSVPLPKTDKIDKVAKIDLRIFEPLTGGEPVQKKGKFRQIFSGKLAADDTDHLIPLTFDKPDPKPQAQP